MPRVSARISAHTFVCFPLSRRTKVSQPPFEISFINENQVLITADRVLLLVREECVPIPIGVVVRVTVREGLSTGFVYRVRSRQVVSVVFMYAILVSVDEANCGERIFPVLARVVRLYLRVLLLVVTVPCHHVYRPDLVRFVLNLRIGRVFLFSQASSHGFFLF